MPVTPVRPFVINQNTVWDINTLSWVPMVQPVIEFDTVAVQLPNEGQQTMASSISVTVASDQTPIVISGAVVTL